MNILYNIYETVNKYYITKTVTLNRFCPLSKKKKNTPCSSWAISGWIEYQPKSNEKYMPLFTLSFKF